MGIYEHKYECGCLSTTTTLERSMQTFITRKCNKGNDCDLQREREKGDEKFKSQLQETLSRLNIDKDRLCFIRGNNGKN